MNDDTRFSITAPNQSTLTKAERALMPSRPRMFVHDHVRAVLAQSSLLRRAYETAIADALAGALEVMHTRTQTECDLRKKALFVAYVEKGKAITIAAVNSAIEINAAIEA